MYVYTLIKYVETVFALGHIVSYVAITKYMGIKFPNRNRVCCGSSKVLCYEHILLGNSFFFFD